MGEKISKLSKLRDLKGKIAKGNNGKTFGMAVNIHRNYPRISSGSLALDRALGGGFAAGKCTVLWGGEGSGKTATMYRAAGNAQNLCANCLREVKDLEVVEDIDEETGEVEYFATGTCDCYKTGVFKAVQYPDEKSDEYKARLKEYAENSYEELRVGLFDMEGSMDFEWASLLGLDTRRLMYMRPGSAEEVIDVYEAWLRSGQVHMVLLDSIALMPPGEEIEKSAHDLQQGLQARVMGKFTRKLTATSNSVFRDFGRLPTHIWINQERQKIGGYGGGKVQPGGNASKFFTSVIVYFFKQKGDTVNMNDGMIAEHKQELMTEVLINFKVGKNRTFTENITGMYRLIIAGDKKGQINELKYVLAMAEKHGIFRTDGAGAKKKWYLGDEEYTKKSDIMERVSDPEVFEAMKKTLISKILNI